MCVCVSPVLLDLHGDPVRSAGVSERLPTQSRMKSDVHHAAHVPSVHMQQNIAYLVHGPLSRPRTYLQLQRQRCTAAACISRGEYQPEVQRPAGQEAVLVLAQLA